MIIAKQSRTIDLDIAACIQNANMEAQNSFELLYVTIDRQHKF